MIDIEFATEPDLQLVIKERFGVDYHERDVSTLLKKLGFSQMSAKPSDPAQGGEIIEAFRTISRARCWPPSWRPANCAMSIRSRAKTHSDRQGAYESRRIDWGRIGAAGRSKIETFPDMEGLTRARTRLERQKRRRGYLESRAQGSCDRRRHHGCGLGKPAGAPAKAIADALNG